MNNLMPPPLAALCRLQPCPMIELAERVGLQKSNLLAALARRRPLPEKCVPVLYREVGLTKGEGLDASRAHRWKIRHADDLEAVVDEWLTGTVVRPLGGKQRARTTSWRYWILDALTRADGAPIYAILRGFDQEAARLDSAQILDTPVLVEDLMSWFDGHIGPEDVATALTQRDGSDGHEPVSWADLAVAAERLGLSPEDAWKKLFPKGRTKG